MSEYEEYVGKNINNALEKASKALNIDAEKLDYDVVSYGASGIFGLVGAKKAKIRVRKNGSGKIDDFQIDARQRAVDLVKDAFNLDDDAPKSVEDSKVQTYAQQDERVQIDEKIHVDIGEPAETLSVETQEAVSLGQQALKRIIDEISTDSKISADIRNARVVYSVESSDSGLIIGKRGQTLEAIQYVVEKIVNKKNNTRLRVLVDVEGYLKNRRTNLKRLASKMAEKAQRINKPVTIGQMNAYDRRTVHIHLKDNPSVRTQSMGEGYYRKLVIFPKRRKRTRKKEEA
ncbi:MAG: KH domain-containing protein [Desulfatitalea sp.]|nr:Jag N-terminal domain-containing protein [Desulfatitalea sp.]NNK01786.1 KH domain-containing protein [Desulfatitalea sp.]